MHHCPPPLIESTYTGGSAGKGVIFSYDTCHQTFEVIHDFSNPEYEGANPVGNIIRMNDGSLVGVTQNDGKLGKGTLFKLRQQTDGNWTFDVLKSFCNDGPGCPGGGNPSGNLYSWQDSRGRMWVYGTNSTGGAKDKGTMFRDLPLDNQIANVYYVVGHFK